MSGEENKIHTNKLLKQSNNDDDDDNNNNNNSINTSEK
jgi:hypothetical protein